MKKRIELLIENGPSADRRFSVGTAGVRLGRSSSNDIQISDGELSRNHCLLEQSGEDGVRLIDLASANGTFVNGAQVGAEPVELHVGDQIALGATHIRVLGEGETLQIPPPAAPATPPASGTIDLGLGTASPPGAATAAPDATASKRRSPIVYALWAVAALVMGLAGWLLFFAPDPSAMPAAASMTGVQSIDTGATDRIVEMSYEKVSADSTGIFRFHLALTSDGTLKVTVDDVPEADRHIVKSERMSPEALTRMHEILADADFLKLDHEFAGPVEEPPKLESCVIKVVYSGRVKSVRVVNTPEPDAFRRMREQLESFTKNELGIWAIQYSTDKLIELSQESARTAETKYGDREVEYGNLHAAISAWREAMFYLETVNPKPPAYEEYRAKKESAEKELAQKYSDQRFRADRALNLGDWTTAAAELKILCALVPDRNDERYRDASAKLLDVEKRQKKGGAK